MNNKHISYTVIAMLFVISMISSCGKSDNGMVPSPVEDVSETISVRFSLHVGADCSPVTYAIHDATEYAINKLLLLAFRSQGNDFVLQRTIDLTTKISGQPGPNFDIVNELLVEDRGVYMFLFVANEELNIANGTSIEQVKTLLSDRRQDTHPSTAHLAEGGIPMTGFARQGQGANTLIAVTGSTQCSVVLERIVSRVDIRNRAADLVITDVKMRGVPARSLLLKPDYTSFVVAQGGFMNTPVTPNAAMPSPFDNGKDMLKAFYLFENAVSDVKDTPKIEIFGKYKDIPVLYNISFVREDKVIPFRRNHQYILQLGDGSSTVKPEDWTEVPMNNSFYIIRIQQMQTDGKLTYDEDKSKKNEAEYFTLSLDNKAHQNQKLKMEVPFSEHKNYIVGITPSDTQWITVSADDKYVTFSIDKNTTGAPRNATLSIRSDAYADENGYCYIEIVQEL